MKRTILASFILIPAIAACSHHANGLITTKQYEQGYTTLMSTVCGKSTCLVPNYVPPAYVLYVNHKRCEIDPTTWSHYQKGQHFDGQCS